MTPAEEIRQAAAGLKRDSDRARPLGCLVDISAECAAAFAALLDAEAAICETLPDWGAHGSEEALAAARAFLGTEGGG